MPPPERERGARMGLRVVRTAAELGLGPTELDLLAAAHAAAMAVRDERADDDHDPRYLHPGRSALILLQDVAETDPVALAAAMVVDSEEPAWAPPAEAVEHPDVLALRESIPPSGSEDLAERLVVASDRVRRVALAERLDHLRHAHLLEDREARRRMHAEAVDVYGPVADRTHPVLARRYGWWCRMFGARHLR